MGPERRASRRGGFTLFEVLAAALILVLVGTVAIGSMNADLGRMGDARRRLEAGRLADRALADLEAQLVGGVAPELQNEEEEIDGFLVRKLVTPFGLLFAESETPPRSASPGAAGGADAEPTEFFAFLAQEFPGLPQHLRVLLVQVEWGNELAPEVVRRTSVAFDHQAALAALRDLGAKQDDDASADPATDRTDDQAEEEP